MTLKARITAIDRFIKGCREDGIYDDLNACCVMAGWSNLAGALTPLVGTAPTNSGFLDTDYDRGGIGITGDGSSYLNSNRDNNADGPNDQHLAVFATSPSSDGKVLAGRGTFIDATTIIRSATTIYFRNRGGSSGGITGAGTSTGLYGSSRSAAEQFLVRANNDTQTSLVAATGVISGDIYIFDSNGYGAGVETDATLSFYSIGSSLGSDPATGLAALDARVSTLMSDLRSIEESDFDADALTYIRAVEAADGSYLETDVKVAINQLVAGLKFDSLWDSIGTSCLLCGPRTIAGALVPLRGDAPTPYGFVSGDYSRTGGLGDPDAASYLDSNVSGGEYDDENHHWSVYFTSGSSLANRAHFGYITNTIVGQPDYSYSFLFTDSTNNMLAFYLGTTTFYGGAGAATGLAGMSANNDGTFTSRIDGINKQSAATSQTLYPANYYVFARNNVPGAAAKTDATLAFYSIGTSLDLALLDSHITAYVTAIGAAL